MRTNEERIEAMHRRAAELVREKRERVTRILSFSAAVVCLAVVFGMSFYIPHITGTVDSSGVIGGMNASIFASAGALGYVVVGILAFLLGISVTVFCFLLRKWRDESENVPVWKERADTPDRRKSEDMPDREEKA